MLPKNLVLVRHGRSEGNAASKRRYNGDLSDYDGEFAERRDSLWRLTERGVAQAKAAGDWLRQELDFTFDRHYVSSFIRANETALLLNFPNARWYVDIYMRERSWGDLLELSAEEHERVFEEALKIKRADPLYWRPPNGESIAELCARVDRVFDTLARECSDKNVVAVCHGEFMWGCRIRLERMLPNVFMDYTLSRDPHDRIHNCQILHYTRIDPKSREELPYYGWMRSVCPWDTDRSSNEWREIKRSAPTNEELKALVERYPRIVED